MGNVRLLHRLLLEVDDLQRGLFSPTQPAGGPERLFRCLKRDVGFSRQVSDWREVQANMGMSSLLMPKPIFLSAVKEGRALLGVGDCNARNSTGAETYSSSAGIMTRNRPL